MQQKTVRRSLLPGLLIACLGISTTAPTLAAEKKTLTVASSDWCPLLCYRTPQKPGVMVEILRKAFPESEYNIKLESVEWTKAVEDTRAGQFSMIGGGFRSDSPDFVFPAEGQGAIRECFYTQRKNQWFFSDVASLDQLGKIGTGEGYTYDEPLMGWLKAHPEKNLSSKAEEVFPDNLGKLTRGEVDAIQEADVIVQWALMTASTPPDIRQAGCQGKPKEVYFAFSPALPDSRALADKLSVTTMEMRKSGELKKLLAKYNLYDWK